MMEHFVSEQLIPIPAEMDDTCESISNVRPDHVENERNGGGSSAK